MRSPFVACLALLAALSAVASRADAADSAEDCVRLSSNPVDKGVSLEVDNHCDRALSCRLTWTVACESGNGKVSRTRAGAAQLAVGASASGRALASTAECGEGWHVDDVRWVCAPVK